MTDALGPPRPPSRTLAVLLLALAGLVTVGRLALDAWLVRPEPDAPAAGTDPAPGAFPAARTGRPPPFLLAVVDGLRAESASGPEAAMPFWASLAAEGASGVAMTGEPTMTACCVRTLLTGRNPDIYTAFRNFDAAPVRGSLVEFLGRRGARAAHAGDASAWQMTSAWYRPEDVLAFPDRGPADQGETDDLSFPFAMGKARDPGVDLLTFHVVRPDHAGHAHGATGPPYRAACATADGMLRDVVTAFRAARPGATVLCAADHGVTPRGNHGGGEPGARRAPFVLVGPRVARRSGVEVPQASLAPTVAALLGLPQPPLAEAPPSFDLTALSPAERAEALDAYVLARLEVARRSGAADVAEAVEARRARAFAAGQGPALETLAALEARELAEGAFARAGTLAALAALLLAGLWLAALARAGTAGLPAPGARPAGGAIEAAFAALALLAGFELPAAAAAAALLLATAALAWRTPWPARGARALVLPAFAAVPVLGAAGLALQDAFDAAHGAAGAALRATLALSAVAAAALLLARREAVREGVRSLASRHPGALAALGGVAIGFPLTMRLFLDPIVHTPVPFALASAAGVAFLALRPASRAAGLAGPRALLLACAALLFLGGRLAVVLWGDDWPFGPIGEGAPVLAGLLAAGLLLLGLARGSAAGRADRLLLVPAALALVGGLASTFARGVPLTAPVVAAGLLALGLSAAVGSPAARLDARLLAATGLAAALHERGGAAALAFALLALGARAAGAFPAARTRGGVVGLALLLLLVRTAALHAGGFPDSFSGFDLGAARTTLLGAGAEAQGTQGVTGEMLATVALQALRHGLAWVVLLSAAAHAFSRDGVRAGLGLLAGDAAVALAARGAAIVGGLWVWWRSSWWLKYAYPAYAFAAADAVFLIAAWALVGGLRRTPGSAPAPSEVLAPEPAAAAPVAR